jgi:hypothetical protein
MIAIAAPGQPERICPECDHVMRLVHKGRFTTLYVCPTCACTLTLPPAVPAVPPEGPKP